MQMRIVIIANYFLFILPLCHYSFHYINPKFSTSTTTINKNIYRVTHKLYSIDDSKMTIDEMKAELDLRGVDYTDCVSKNELLERLRDTRTLGKADPSVISKFNELNKNELDSQSMGELLDSEIAEEIQAKDGSLPGGMNAGLMKALAADPDISRMLRDPRMQEIMSAVMTGGPQGLQKVLYKDIK
jgi:hypothetical protein